MKEYFRKPWLSKSYHEMMSKNSNSAIWAQIKQKHSEFEKPYLYKMGQYAEMQHYFPNLPGLSGIPSFSLSGIKFDDMRFDHPWMGRPVDDVPDWQWIHVVFFCGGDPCWCPNQTMCFDMGCTHPIDHIEPTWSWSCQGLDFYAANGQICITAGDEDSVDSSCEIDVIMRAFVYSSYLKRKVIHYGQHGGISIKQCSDDDCISCDCTDITISYTTQQMAVDEVQTLTVTNGTADCTYDWAIDSGGGSLSAATGLSVDYTAPSSNAECAENPVISLKCEGETCDTLQIAINGWAGDEAASLDYAWWYQPISPYYNCSPSGEPDYGCMSHYNKCDATLLSRNIWYCQGSQATCEAADYHYDQRTSAMKTGGCCTSYLL